MGFLSSIFTWWNGATIGTALFTRRHGSKVGVDAIGNAYFQGKDDGTGRRRRWVIYQGANDASRVPPEWHGWLHNTIDELPDQGLPPQRVWEKPAVANLTGTNQAFRPSGALEAGGRRAAATGDYQPWSPDAP